MAYNAFVEAVKLIDRLEKRSNSSIIAKGQTQLLKQQLRFLRTFLKYTANRCKEQDFEPRIDDVRQSVEEKLLKIDPRKKLSSLEFGEAVGDALDKIDLIKPSIREAQMRVSMLSRLESRKNVVKFVGTLQEDLKELIDCKADLLEPSLKEGIKVLARKLRFLIRLVQFTEDRCKENDKLNKLFTHVQAMADTAAYLAYSCLSNETDQEGIARGLAVELSELIQKIEPVRPEVREIYVGVVKASESKSYKIDEAVVKFVDSLLENTADLLCIHGNIMPVKDQIEILHMELRSLRYFLQDAATSSNHLLADVETMAIDAGLVIYELFERDAKQEVANEMKLTLSKLLEKFKLFMVQVRKKYIHAEKTHIHNYQITNALGVLDLLLRSLKELLKNDRVGFITPLKHHIQVVQRDLEFLRTFLTTIAKQHHKDEKLDNLWRRIILVVYEVEYVIDLVVVDDCRVLHHMLWLSDLIEEIKFIKTEVCEIQIPDSTYGIQIENDLLTKKSSSHEMLSLTNTPRIDAEMVGFEDEKEKLIEQLLSDSKQLQIVALVGMAGRGKTFLAQKVYNNPTIKHHFYVQVWCNVSQVYERKELLLNILSQVKNSAQDKICQNTDEELAAELHKCLKRQKYLIVLDDIWDTGAWNALRRSFPNDNKGSRIVFTSRLPPLALQARPDSKVHELRSFSDGESWDLLQKKVFQTESCPSELLEVGEQIAISCKGLPLAVVVVAGLLARVGKEQDRWRQVADKLSSHIISDPQYQCKDILDLSYKNLPDYLRPCFLYFGAFLEDEEIPVAKLTKLWIAEGFVLPENESNLECVAESYLMDLIDKSLIIASKKRSTGGVKTCLIHDLVRDFCLEKAKEENFLKVTDATCGDLSTICGHHRRLFVHCRQRKQIYFKSSAPYIRSLLFFASRRIRLTPSEVSSVIHKFPLLRVLDLMCIELSCFPQKIERLAQLKYLAFSGNFHSFPSFITKLGNLETLILRAILGEISPYTILEMTKLRHLHIKYFRFPNYACHYSPLQLDSLRTMSRPFLSYGDDMKIMRSFPNLTKLNCVLRGSWDSSSKCNRLPELDILSNLESLKVSYKGDMRHPCEFSLPSNIKKLTMSMFRLPWEKISVVGKLLNLEVLKLDFDAFEGQEWNMEDGEFPKLKFLKLKHLNLRKWIASTADCFPLLERLILVGCRQLEEIPSCLEDVQTLKMILVEECSNCLETSIKQIEEEQRDMGNEELQIEIKRCED